MKENPTAMKSIFLAFLLTAASLSAADRVALVIGNNDYDDSGKLTDLRACRLDAQLIRRTLEAVGFTVILGEDQDRAGMDDLLTRFESTIPKGGTAVVYFAGHAIEFDGKNYLLGTNAKLQARSRLTEEAMNAETFASAMLLAGAKSSFLLLDCCRNAPTDSEWLTRGATRKAGLAQIDVDGDIIIGYAAKPGASALEPAEPGMNSPYATALAKWIPSGFKHGDVFEKVRQEVNETTGGLQRTWENGSFLEPYYFVSTGTAPVVPSRLPMPLPHGPAGSPPERGELRPTYERRPDVFVEGLKVGYIDFARLQREFKKTERERTAYQAKREDERTRVDQLKKSLAELESTNASAAEIPTLKTAIAEAETQANARLFALANEVQKQLTGEIYAMIGEVAAEKAYDIVYNRTFGINGVPTMAYSSSRLLTDFTDDVLSRLNK
jgi:Skp family chaperone for outer membrane proteins